MEKSQSNLEKVESPDLRGKWFRRYWWLLLLLVLTIAIYGVYAVLSSPKTPAGDFAHVDAFYEAPVVLSTRGGDMTFSAPLISAMSAYAERDWNTAAAEFRNVTKANELPVAKYYLAHCLYQSGLFDAALSAFSECRTKGPYIEQADWFIILCHLKKGENALAVELLTRISEDPGHFYHDRALELRSTLLAD